MAGSAPTAVSRISWRKCTWSQPPLGHRMPQVDGSNLCLARCEEFDGFMLLWQLLTAPNATSSNQNEDFEPKGKHLSVLVKSQILTCGLWFQGYFLNTYSGERFEWTPMNRAALKMISHTALNVGMAAELQKDSAGLDHFTITAAA